MKPNLITSLVAIFSAALSMGVGSLMLMSHLPFRNDGGRVNQIAAQLGIRRGKWIAIDVLASHCACSRRVAEHLLARGPLKGIEESVVLIGPDGELGFRFKKEKWSLTAVGLEDAAAKFGIQGAPSFLLIDPHGALKYLGGYSPDRSSLRPSYQDQEIWESVRGGQTVEPLPILGCAVGRSLQRRVDPLGLKYGLFDGKG